MTSLESGFDPLKGQEFFPTDYQVETAGKLKASSSLGQFPVLGNTSFDDEPPLLEELGINFDHIRRKTLAVLNPLRKIDTHIMDDTDMAGPLVFALLLGTALLLKGKIHFGYIYGVGAVGCISLCLLLNLMTETTVDLLHTTSVLGYCFLPIVALAFGSRIVPLDGVLGLCLSVLVITWCTHSASLMFVTGLSMKEQRLLVVYPVAMLYACFLLLTIY